MTLIFSFLVVLIAPSVVQSAALEYIDSSRATELRSRFDLAEQIRGDQLLKLNQSKWTCEMFGLSSRIQVERDVKLYHFKLIKAENQLPSLKNLGAQVVTNYLAEPELKGTKDSFMDHIRLSKDGRLISKLELLSPGTESPRTLAISVCKRLGI